MSLLKTAKEHGITSSSREENRELFQQIAAGGRAKQRLVEGNMAYVVTKVDRFLIEFPSYNYLRDDMISQGFLVLARIAEKVEGDGDVSEDNFAPQGLMSLSLRNEFLMMIHVEREVPLTDAITENLLCDTMPVTDLKLDILACCVDDLDREIVRLRCEGLLDPRIGEILGYTSQHISRLRSNIFERLQEA